MAFHSIYGWYFERMENGGVRIRKMDERHDHQDEIILAVELPADTWASAVASVSAEGETSETFNAARALHG